LDHCYHCYLDGFDIFTKQSSNQATTNQSINQPKASSLSDDIELLDGLGYWVTSFTEFCKTRLRKMLKKSTTSFQKLETTQKVG